MFARRLHLLPALVLIMVAQAALGQVARPQRLLIQQVEADRSDDALYYYLVLDNEEGTAVERGTMDTFGIDRIILAPLTSYTILALFADDLTVAEAAFTTPRAGVGFVIPDLTYSDIVDFDTDSDGLSDLREFIVGTNLQNPDTDLDGVNDGPEVMQGLNPLDGFLVDTGIVATGPVDTEANLIAVRNNIAVVGSGSGGITVFDVKQGTNPLRIAQLPIPGNVQGIDVVRDQVAVAAGTGGFVIIDTEDPPAAEIEFSLLFQDSFGNPLSANAVVVNGSVAFVGLSNGTIVAVDMFSGFEISRLTGFVNENIIDLGIANNHLYALSYNGSNAELWTAEVLSDSDLIARSNININERFAAGQRPFRLFLGDTYALVSVSTGYYNFDLADPANPAFTEEFSTQQFGWKEVVANGTNHLLAAASANSTDDGEHNIDLYEIDEGGLSAEFVTRFETPFRAAAVTIFNGLAYVAEEADGQGGRLAVINYLSYDTAGAPPAITLETNADQGEFEEGKVITVTANVNDDVQVRNVEFFLDNTSFVIDGNFPFEVRLVTPFITDDTDTFIVHAVATDTGGNSETSEFIEISLVPDGTAPFIRRNTPRDGAIIGEISTVSIIFSEPIDLETVLEEQEDGSIRDNVTVTSAGDDGIVGTADDIIIDSRVTFDDEATRAYVNLEEGIAPGLYTLRVAGTVSDLAGNELRDGTFLSRFRVAGFGDSDQDGVPDDLEPELGLVVGLIDTDGNGLIDGDEDFDDDGLTNAGESIFGLISDDNPTGLDPRVADANGNGILDGDEDGDFDGLSNGLEISNGTNPTVADSDDDGWPDEAETTAGSDPLDKDSVPELFVASRPPIAATITTPQVDLAFNAFVVSRPQVAVFANNTRELLGVDFGSVVSRPMISVAIPNPAADLSSSAVVVSYPPVGIAIPNPAADVDGNATVIARPPVEVTIPAQD